MLKKNKIILIASVSFIAIFFLSQTALGKYLPFSDLSQNIQNKILGLFGLGSSQEKESIQLLLINEVTYKEGVNNIGDIVGVFDGDHQFSENEQHSFDIVRVDGITREKAEAKLNALLPDTSSLNPEEINNRTNQPKYQFKVLSKNEITLGNLTEKIETNVKLK